MYFIHMAWLNFKGQRAAFNLEEFLLLETAYPFFTLIFYCVLASYAYDTTNITDWVIGNSFLLCTNICVFSLGNCFVGERYFGRIRSIIVGSVSKIEIILAKGFFPALVGVITTFLGFYMGCLVFNISWTDISWGNLLYIYFAAMFSAMGFGLFLAVLGLVSNQMHLILNLIQYILLIFTGANFPITQLPTVLQKISLILPLTRSIQASREIVSGKGLETVTLLLAGDFIVGIVYITIAVVVVKYVERIAIKKGTLELF